mgnify:CR=1 FL=1
MSYVEAATAPLRKTGQIKLHGPEGFAGMRCAGRLVAEVLDLLIDIVKPGVTTRGGLIGTPANVIAPGKRMLSSMTPLFVAKDGKLLLVTGSPGGRTNINTVLCVVVNTGEFGMNAGAGGVAAGGSGGRAGTAGRAVAGALAAGARQRPRAAFRWPC